MNHGNWEIKSRHRVPFSRFLPNSRILQRGWYDSRAISDHTPGPNVRMGTTACPSYGVSSRGPGTMKPSIEIPATITRCQLIPHHLPSLLSAYSNAMPQHLVGVRANRITSTSQQPSHPQSGRQHHIPTHILTTPDTHHPRR